MVATHPLFLAGRLETALLVPALALAGALLLGAALVALFRRWQNDPVTPNSAPSDELARYRSLYERGEISEEEFKRLRGVLGGEIRRAVNLPGKPTGKAPARPDGVTPPPKQKIPDEPENPPQEGDTAH